VRGNGQAVGPGDESVLIAAMSSADGDTASSVGRNMKPAAAEALSAKQLPRWLRGT